jgi:hypothetical protein
MFGGRERAACDDVFEAGSVVLWVSWSFSIYICRNRLNVVCECLNHSSTPVNESTGYKTSEFSDPKPLFHLALVTTFAASNAIHKPEGMVIVVKREIRSWDYSTGRRRPQTGAGARYIVPVRAIQGAAHLIPIKEKDGCGDKSWFLNNTVDLEIFNLIY